MAALTDAAIDRVIQRNMRAFKKPGVMTVRPGLEMTGGWITPRRAIVVTVDKKLDGLSPAQMLPSEVEDIPVDVREATGLQRLRDDDPDAYQLAHAHMRPEYQEPVWHNERNVGTGEPVVTPSATTPATKHVGNKPSIPYTGPANATLAAVTAPMTITGYATPDAQNKPLKDFLAKTDSRLTIAMYDFTSSEMLEAVEAAIKGKPFTMVLDHPPKNATANQTDEETRTALLAADEGHAEIDWALTRNDPVATGWIFPTAYHIKVAVQDGKQFWLSSGNFNVSNQPDLDAGDPKLGSLKNADRDWHVIVTCEPLAKTFETFILHDFTVAQGYQGQGDEALHQKIRGAIAKLHAAQARSTAPPSDAGLAKFTAGEPKTFTGTFTVQPLLTPDKVGDATLYVQQVVALIDGAKQSCYMQTQYIHVSTPDVEFMTLITALQNAMKRGVDVRLITSQYENTGQWLEKLKPTGLDEVLRIQQRVHNKGIVVDGKAVLVSSQNWSADGCLHNRDAGLIIENPDIAAYFQGVFMDDWTSGRATKSVVDVSHPAKAAAKPAARKPASRKATSPKATSRKAATRKPAARKAASRKPAAPKAESRKPTARKAATRKAATRKAATRKGPARKTGKKRTLS